MVVGVDRYERPFFRLLWLKLSRLLLWQIAAECHAMHNAKWQREETEKKSTRTDY